MKKILTFLLAIAVIFTFSFAAVAETTVKSDTKTSINFTQTKASPVAPVAVASPGDLTGVISEFSNATTVDLSFTTDEIGTLQIAKNQISNRQNEPAMTIDYVSPPSETRVIFDRSITNWRTKRYSIPPTDKNRASKLRLPSDRIKDFQNNLPA